jgi:transcription-repair coupling factor (superfamily II helicase)
VGRSANRAYAYLLYKPDRTMSEEAQQRLQAIQEATELGAGFRIAMRDLEIRGAGNLLGGEQSGHIAAVGFDLYSRLLEQAVQQLKQHPQNGRQPAPESKPADEAPTARRRRAVVNEKVLVSPLVTLDLPLTAYLPTDYIPDESVRLGVYQRMVEAQSPDEIESLRQELRDRFGEVPEPAEHLLTWLHIKVLALAAGVPSVITSESEFIVRLPVLGALERERLKRHFARERGVHVAQQSIRLERRLLKSRWIGVLTDVLEVVGQQVGRAPASATSATQ